MIVVVPSVAIAERIVTDVGTAAGLPRCQHPRWRLTPAELAERLRGRGRVDPCPCASATDVSIECPHVTWQAAAVIRLEDGTVCVEASAAALAAVPEAQGLPSRALSVAEREASEEPWRLRDARGEGRA